ncbi:heavy metal-binding domain-containing protein [uncultured Desulfuromonas sp.]|uniref:heavy metal-binding domain-containing protein n=1 Tax=uncultured Desulfuromonas sp. TaxID=181013 RepID=UPI002AABEC6F|nr:heavy metal-binding domain-containing protein [uncultured Desulfuromonas sp.]
MDWTCPSCGEKNHQETVKCICGYEEDLKTSEVVACGNCGAKAYYRIFSNEYLLLPEELCSKINTFYHKKASSYCTKCSQDIIRLIISGLSDSPTTKEASDYFFKTMPVVTNHTPHQWEYTTLGAVTAQAIIGTGLFSSITADAEDFFGGMSNALMQKFTKAEKLAFDALRSKAKALGGNAVIATKVDYEEVGGSRGMLMVAASGTAVRINNCNIALGFRSKFPLDEQEAVKNELDQLLIEIERLAHSTQS